MDRLQRNKLFKERTDAIGLKGVSTDMKIFAAMLMLAKERSVR